MSALKETLDGLTGTLNDTAVSIGIGVYQISGVSKVFTVLAALKTSGTHRNRITTIDWDEITLQALSSYVGGIGSDLITDLTSFPADCTSLGLPPAREVLGCAGLEGILLVMRQVSRQHYLI
ncbi:hypothetical protein F5Y06DRAFT_292525 [Hypoxylon sp. FL0890]|nr:hypothetical protein F5Y06DRAFT_292525 [Hypoxylon sp. FL0890]